MGRALVFLDCETTSLDERTRQAWEIAMIKVEGGARTEVSFMVSGVDMTYADPVSLRVGGYFDRHPVGRAVMNKSPLDPRPEVLSEHAAAVVVAPFTQGAQIVGAQPDCGVRRQRQRHRQRPSTVVVEVLADQIDPARSHRHRVGGNVMARLEVAAELACDVCRACHSHFKILSRRRLEARGGVRPPRARTITSG